MSGMVRIVARGRLRGTQARDPLTLLAHIGEGRPVVLRSISDVGFTSGCWLVTPYNDWPKDIEFMMEHYEVWLYDDADAALVDFERVDLNTRIP